LLPPKRRAWSWRSRAARGFAYQVLAVLVIGGLLWLLAHNTLENMRVRGIQSGFGFLAQPAGFDIGESVIGYDALDPYWKAFLVGVLNTLRVAIAGIILATLLGTLVGVGRLSRNAILRGLCYGYVEVFRNVPVLLQLLMWYLLFTDIFPAVNEPMSVGGLFFFSKGGLATPWPTWPAAAFALTAAGLVAGIVAAVAWRRWAMRDFDRTGRAHSFVLLPIALVVMGAVAGWAIAGAPREWSVPAPGAFMMEGGASATPEFLGVLIGLVLYTAAFIAEVVRAGIQAVPHGQIEAAASLGLSRAHTMRLVTLPQALRVIIPPMTSQYLNLTKNSSLAVAIGYPDVVSIANTALNQTGRAVECIAIIMAVYLTTSLATAAFMGWYNRASAIKER
jgi:general L-amino acid transport system permease protein